MSEHLTRGAPIAAELDYFNMDTMGATANLAFKMGWRDAKAGLKIKTREQVFDDLFPQGARYRGLHMAKLRQIYGAGYDLGALRKEIETGAVK